MPCFEKWYVAKCAYRNRKVKRKLGKHLHRPIMIMRLFANATVFGIFRNTIMPKNINEYTLNTLVHIVIMPNILNT